MFCSDVLPSGRRWQNGLELFHGLELCSALEMLLRSHCVTELEPELVVAALDNCPAFANNGLIQCLSDIYSSYRAFFLLVGRLKVASVCGQRAPIGRYLDKVDKDMVTLSVALKLLFVFYVTVCNM